MTPALTDRIEKAWEGKEKGKGDIVSRVIELLIRESAAYFLPRAWTAEELRSLPIGTLVADADGDIWVRNEHGMQLRRGAGQHHGDCTKNVTLYPPQHITHLPEEN